MTVIVRRPMSKVRRASSYLASGILLSLTAALILEGAFSIHLLLTWLISINVFTMIFYWIDKLNAGWVGEKEAREALQMRIPVFTLLALAAVGGSVGGLVGMVSKRHKTRKRSFKSWFVLIVVVQVVALLFLWDRLPWA